jgi:hypothetical protein
MFALPVELGIKGLKYSDIIHCLVAWSAIFSTRTSASMVRNGMRIFAAYFYLSFYGSAIQRI